MRCRYLAVVLIAIVMAGCIGREPAPLPPEMRQAAAGGEAGSEGTAQTQPSVNPKPAASEPASSAAPASQPASSPIAAIATIPKPPSSKLELLKQMTGEQLRRRTESMVEKKGKGSIGRANRR